jgi:nitrite reductase/ring-hydroxylating ferredoxin subunit
MDCLVLYDGRRNREPEKPKPTVQQTKSVLQSYFASKGEPTEEEPPPTEEKTGFFRNLFRQNKTDEAKQEPSPQPTKKTRREKRTSENEAAAMEKFRQTSQKNEKAKKDLPKKGSKKIAKEEGDQDRDGPSLLGRVVGWLSSKGNATEAKVQKQLKKGEQNNSTNPVSALQQLWQDTVARRSEEWVDVLPTTRMAPGEVVPVTVGGLDLLIVAGQSSGNKIYAIENSCPHLGTPLEIGQLVRLPKEDAGAGTSCKNDKKEETGQSWTELQVSSLLQQDGCEDCIVCPLHRTAFALESGQVRGEWCPYPPVVGKVKSSWQWIVDACGVSVLSNTFCCLANWSS